MTPGPAPASHFFDNSFKTSKQLSIPRLPRLQTLAPTLPGLSHLTEAQHLFLLFTPHPSAHQCPQEGSGCGCPAPIGNRGTCTLLPGLRDPSQRSSCRTRRHPESNGVSALSQTAGAPGVLTHPPGIPPPADKHKRHRTGCPG